MQKKAHILVGGGPESSSAYPGSDSCLPVCFFVLEESWQLGGLGLLRSSWRGRPLPLRVAAERGPRGACPGASRAGCCRGGSRAPVRGAPHRGGSRLSLAHPSFTTASPLRWRWLHAHRLRGRVAGLQAVGLGTALDQDAGAVPTTIHCRKVAGSAPLAPAWFP